jgi:hypothetical protein
MVFVTELCLLNHRIEINILSPIYLLQLQMYLSQIGTSKENNISLKNIIFKFPAVEIRQMHEKKME